MAKVSPLQFEFVHESEYDLSEWERIVGKLADDLDMLLAGQTTETDVQTYIGAMLDALRPVENTRHQDMLFLMFDHPASLDAHDRVDYVYRPTYLAAAFMMTAVCRYRSLQRNGSLLRALRPVLNAAMGRDFYGAGSEHYTGFLDTLQIFATGDTLRFINEYPWINEDFAKKLRSAIAFVQTDICTGKITDGWSGKDYSERGKKLLKRFGMIGDGSPAVPQ